MSKENPVQEEVTTSSAEQTTPLSEASDNAADVKQAEASDTSTPPEHLDTSAPDTSTAPKEAVPAPVTAPAPSEPAPSDPEPSDADSMRWESEPVKAPKVAASQATTADAVPTKPGFAARCFTLCAAVGPLVLLVLWAVQALPVLMGRELRGLYALASGVYEPLLLGLQAGTGGGGDVAATGVVLPVFGWFLTTLEHIPGLDTLSGLIPGFVADPLVLPLATCLTTLLLVQLTWVLARATGNDTRTALASGLVVLAALTLIGLPALAGDALLFAGLLTLASLCLFRGWIKTCAPVWLGCGFAVVALATLSGGLAGLLVPLGVSLLFLVWRCTFRRAGSRDGALAFGFMLVLLCAWGTSVAFSDGGRDVLAALLQTAVLDPVQEIMRSQGRELLLVVPVLALLWLPWVLLLPFLPWERLGSFLKNSVRNRTQRPGQGWIWCSLIGGSVILGLFGAGDPLYLLPLLPPLAILTAQGILSLSAVRNRGFILLLSALFLLTGVLFAVASVYPLLFETVPSVLVALHPATLPLTGALVAIGVCVVFGLALWKLVNRDSASGSLLAVTVLAVVLAAPFAWYTAPVATLAQPPASEEAVPVPPASVAPETPASETTAPAVPAPETPVAPPETAAPATPEAPPVTTPVTPPVVTPASPAPDTATPPVVSTPATPVIPATPETPMAPAPTPEEGVTPQTTPAPTL